jgi:hypothetical protein
MNIAPDIFNILYVHARENYALQCITVWTAAVLTRLTTVTPLRKVADVKFFQELFLTTSVFQRQSNC